MKLAQGDVNTRWAMYEYLAKRSLGGEINGNNHGVSPSPEVIAKSV